MQAEVDKYLSTYGWEYSKSSPNQWDTGWQGESRSFPLKIEHFEFWLSFEVSEFIKLSNSLLHFPEVQKELLELNDKCKHIRICMNEGNNISLKYDLFCQNLKYKDFELALSIIGYYADKLYCEINMLLEDYGVFSPKLLM